MKVVRKNLSDNLVSWLYVGGLLALCGILGWLQYRWIAAVSVADRERLQQHLQADLNRLSQEFNRELTSTCRALIPAHATQDEFEAAYARWRSSSRHTGMFSSIAIAIPQNEELTLFDLDIQCGKTSEIAWPDGWKSVEYRLKSRLGPDGRRGHRGPQGGASAASRLLDVPIFVARTSPANGPGSPFGRREAGWLVLDVNVQYVRHNMLPELIQRNLGNTGGPEYEVQVTTRSNPPDFIFQSGTGSRPLTADSADASVGLFDLQMDQLFPRPEPPGMREHLPGPPPSSPNSGRWQMSVRSRAGSLDAVVAGARRRNLAVTGGVLLLLAASIGALLRLTRRAQRLAQLQMDFVAGVSHELRTPLAVIYGAAYNLRGAVAQNPAQVERYGSLLQQESGRLRDLVEQILRFSGAQAGRVIQDREPVSIRQVIDDAIESSTSSMQNAQFAIEKHVDPNLPAVLADPIALKHALQNLVSNAVKYGRNGNNWIGVSVSEVTGKNEHSVEIRVADHGPGIPDDERNHVFDAFFRGRRAIQDQIHGTGLGLNLVKKIVEAHGGTIRVESEPMKLTEFIVRLPATPEIGIGE